MKNKTIIFLLIVFIAICYIPFAVLDYMDTKPEYRNLSRNQKIELDEKLSINKEDLYKNQLLYDQITDYIIKNHIITISFDKEPYEIEILDNDWFKKVDCINGCLLGNNMNIIDVMRQLGIARIINTKIYPPKDLQKNYIIFVKDQTILVRGWQERGYRKYFETIWKNDFTDRDHLIKPIDDHWAIFGPTVEWDSSR